MKVFSTFERKMKIHTTNYINTFIEVADDCPVEMGIVPLRKGQRVTAAIMQYEMISENPYIFTSDDVIFSIFATKNNVSKAKREAERLAFFSKAHACFRASPLCKQYGFGVHSDAEGRLAIFGMETEGYKALIANEHIRKVKAMRSKRPPRIQ